MKYDFSLNWPNEFSRYIRTVNDAEREDVIAAKVASSRAFFEKNKGSMSEEVRYFWEDLSRHLDHEWTRIKALDYLVFLAKWHIAETNGTRKRSPSPARDVDRLFKDHRSLYPK